MDTDYHTRAITKLAKRLPRGYSPTTLRASGVTFFLLSNSATHGPLHSHRRLRLSQAPAEQPLHNPPHEQSPLASCPPRPPPRSPRGRTAPAAAALERGAAIVITCIAARYSGISALVIVVIVAAQRVFCKAPQVPLTYGESEAQALEHGADRAVEHTAGRVSANHERVQLIAAGQQLN
jgi:hypothetical protein